MKNDNKKSTFNLKSIYVFLLYVCEVFVAKNEEDFL